MTLTPIRNNIIFTFVDDTSGGGFVPASGGVIVIAQQNIANNNTPKWGKVAAIGPDVDENIEVGSYIYVTALMWSAGFEYEKTKYWKTDDTQVLVVSAERPDNSF